MSSRIFIALFAFALAATACGESTPESVESASTTPTTTADAASDSTTTTAETQGTDEINGGKPDIAIPDGESPIELETDDLIAGTGQEVATGDYVEMHYVGVLHADGEQFDASWDRGSTFNFTLGQGRVIQGWDDGIVGMKVGGRRLLNIPSEQAYGAAGRPGIPENSGLVFVVDLVRAFTPPTVENVDSPATELDVTVLEEGDGQVLAEGDIVEMHYTVILQTDGSQIASSFADGQAGRFQIGVTPIQTIPAWDQGLLGRRVGDTIRMVIPPGLGINDPSGAIPADATIVSELTIVGVG